MKNLILIIFLHLTVLSHAQYYYKDIVGTQETNAVMQRLIQAKVRSVNLKSFDADGSITQGFFVQQSLTLNPYTLRSVTRLGDGDESVFISIFDENARIKKTIDSSGIVINFSAYEYDEAGKLVMIKSWSIDSTGATTSNEQHEWKYSDGRVLKMVRLRNNIKMDEFRFMHDAEGNVVEEQTYKSESLTDKLFYYYNDKNQLTDIVSRYNSTAKMLMPDYMFEYSTGGQVIQKITVPSKGSDYMIWRYLYDDRGLKIKEAIYDKYKTLVAKIDYTYGY